MFDAMYFEQDGKCAITSCYREAVSVDHDHATGKVRGLVCQGCNVALGFVEDAAWLDCAFDYLRGETL
jgi:Recombination endonuclease VII